MKKKSIILILFIVLILIIIIIAFFVKCNYKNLKIGNNIINKSARRSRRIYFEY